MRAAFAAAAAAVLACASNAPHGQLRVDLPGPGAAQEEVLVDAVRAEAAAEALACQPGFGATLLRCSPATLGNQGHAIVLVLARAGSGYSLSIEQGLRLGRSSAVCDVQRRAAERLAAAVGAPAVRVDRRSDCK